MDCEMKLCSSNIHNHTFTCQKGKKGQYMCRLCMARGVNALLTRPLMLKLIKKGIIEKKEKPIVESIEIDNNMMKFIDSLYNINNDNFYNTDVRGPIVWEQHRLDRDKYFVETNIHMAHLNSHSNSALITSHDIGIAIEQYQIEYMCKEKDGGLNRAASAMLAAMNYIEENKSKAKDKDSKLRQSKFLASRTINALNGGTEYEVRIMILCLLGFKSFITSEKFDCIFP